jgi:hypothetical protein
MNGLFWASYLLLWVLLAIVTALLLLLYRQYGRSLLPAKERLKLAGLDIGTAVPELRVGIDPAASPIRLAADGDGWPAARLLLFASPDCPVCSILWEKVGALSGEWPDIDYLWVQSREPKAGPVPAGWRVISDIEGLARRAMDVPALPYAYVVDSSGIVRAKGLMNGLDDCRAVIREATTERQGVRSSSTRAGF